jgi:hypothetical protein
MVFDWFWNLFRKKEVKEIEIRKEKVKEIEIRKKRQRRRPTKKRRKKIKTEKNKFLVPDQVTKKIISVSPPAPKGFSRETICTKIDDMLKVLEEGQIDFSKLSKRLEISEILVEEWAKILEEHDLAEIYYPPLGSPILKLKVTKES